MAMSPNKVFLKFPEIDWEDDAAIDAAAAQIWEVVVTNLGATDPTPGAEQGGTVSNEPTVYSLGHPTYFSNWKTTTYTCNECTWSGIGAELSIEPFSELFETHCPNCDSKFHLISYPTAGEMRKAAAEGNKEASAELAAFEIRETRLAERQKSRDGRNQLPKIPDATLNFIFSTQGGSDWMNPEWLVLTCNGTEIHRERSGFEHWEPLIEISEILIDRYPGRIGWIDVSSAIDALAGDDFKAEPTVADYLQKNGANRE